MAAGTPALPTVIGPTENALRALLGAVIGRSPVGTYERWVAINAAAGREGTGPVERICDGLQWSRSQALATLADLADDDLLSRAGDGGWSLTADGAVVLSTLRAEVGRATAEVVEGVDVEDLSTAIAVLGEVRANAVAARRRRSPETHDALGPDRPSSPA